MIMQAKELNKGDILKNTNHGFEIQIVDGEKVKSFTKKFNFMLREGVFVK